MNKENVILYGSIIKDYENLSDLTITAGKIYINGTMIVEDTFTKQYYFMVEDNRSASYDTRLDGRSLGSHLGQSLHSSPF